MSAKSNQNAFKMSTLIKDLKHNRKVIFDIGRFDNWCVYVVESNGTKNAPSDVTYFRELQHIASFYPNNKVYSDFVAIYNRTTKHIEKTVIDLIDEIVSTYKEVHKDIIEQWMTVIYAGMIAEENKENALLKKRIKRLGMHQVLVLQISPLDAANYSKGKKWKELDAIMRPYGF
jgi:hypothetical protein